jgi:hypothetical protein
MAGQNPGYTNGQTPSIKQQVKQLVEQQVKYRKHDLIAGKTDDQTDSNRWLTRQIK